MQLAQAIDAWLRAYGANLSDSTKHDIAHIRESVEDVGCAATPCEDVDRQIREDIIAQATETGTLGGSAISEFLSVVLGWAKTVAPVVEDEDDGLGPHMLFRDDDEDDAAGDEDADDEDADDEDDAAGDEAAADAEDDEDEDDAEDEDAEDEPDAVDQVEDADAEDDEHEPDDIVERADDWVSYLSQPDDDGLFVGLAPENEPVATAAPADTAAASSFFEAIGSSSPVQEKDTIVIVDKTATASPAAGVFTAAAEHTPGPQRTGIDWITVAYFTVAAICFALVLYFYLSSR